MSIPIVGGKAAGVHLVSMEFPDDHSIEGGKVRVEGVTVEQIAVAILYLQRSAALIFDAAQFAALQARQSDDAVRAGLSAERNGK